MRAARLAIAAAALTISLGACGSDTATSPSSAAAASSQTEFFSGTIWPGTESSYAFDVAQDGLVTETLGSVTLAGGSRAAVDATLTIGFGVPSGTGCGRSASAETQAGLMPQLAANAPIGIHCADVSAPADAPGPFNFVLRIVHP
jgi:hypothetical protein